MYTIRPHRLDDHDFRAQLELHHLLWAEYPFSMAEWRAMTESALADSTYFAERFVVEDEKGAIVAFGYYGEDAHAYSAGAYMMDIRVHPDVQRRGVGTLALNHIVAGAQARGEPPLRTLIAATRDNRPHSMRFLEHHGFQVTLVTNSSEQQIADFDATPYAPLLDGLAVQGITITSVAALETAGRSWRRELWHLHQTLLADVPAVVAYTPVSFDAYERTVLHHPTFSPSACLVALHQNTFVGMSYLTVRSQKPEELETGMTGVLRDYRRRGIATGLKVKAAEVARAYGARTIMTMNEENNPMYQINLTLGFKPLPRWLTYQRHFEPSPA